MAKRPVNFAPKGAIRALGQLGGQDLLVPGLMASDYLETIVDTDLGDLDDASALAIRVLPSTTPLLVIPYRLRIGSVRQFGPEATRHDLYGAIGTSIMSGVVTTQLRGPSGTIIARIKPEMAAQFFGEDIDASHDAKVGLGDIFGHHAVALLEEGLREAQTSIARIRLVSLFLQAKVRPRAADRVVIEAIRQLNRDPTVRIRDLAIHLDVSERHLSRSFQRFVGSSPKQFARLARFGRVMAARSAGLSWADLSYACGFADQAHMINDIDAILGVSPEQAFRNFTSLVGEDGRPSPTSFLLW